MRKIIFILFLFISIKKIYAQEFIPLWNNNKPNSTGAIVTDSLFNERVWRVGTPGMYAFIVPKSESKGTAVLIAPGGGYERLSHIYNGFQVAKWFNAHGVNAFVLMYRLPHQKDLINKQIGPLQDAQRAMKIIRANAGKWNIQNNKIGIFGISAGGHVVSTIGTKFIDVSIVKDSLDNVNYIPDFLIMVSPVITMGEFAHAGSRKNLLGLNPTQQLINEYSSELHVTPQTPPTFMVHAQNDSTVPVKNSLLFYNALIQNKVKASIHIFPQGAHGIRMQDNPGSTDLFGQLLLLWLTENNFLSPLKSK
jgi:acetyl esterase/lipase